MSTIRSVHAHNAWKPGVAVLGSAQFRHIRPKTYFHGSGYTLGYRVQGGFGRYGLLSKKHLLVLKEVKQETIYRIKHLRFAHATRQQLNVIVLFYRPHQRTVSPPNPVLSRKKSQTVMAMAMAMAVATEMGLLSQSPPTWMQPPLRWWWVKLFPLPSM